MATHGKTTKVFINGRHLSAEFDSFDLNLAADTADASHFNANFKEFDGGTTSGTLSMGGLFMDTATGADAVLSAAVGADTVWCIFPGGDTAGLSGYGIVGNNTSHQVMATKDDVARVTAACQGNNAERVVSLMTLATKTSSGSTTAVDNGAATAAGGSAYLQASAITGSVAVKVEHSSDGTSWSDLVVFAAVAAIGGQRVAITGTINRHTRVTYTLDGGESITLQASLHRA